MRRLVFAAIVLLVSAAAARAEDRVVAGSVEVRDGVARVGTQAIAGELASLVAGRKDAVKVRVRDAGDGKPATVIGVFTRTKGPNALFRDELLSNPKWSVSRDAEIEVTTPPRTVRDSAGAERASARGVHVGGWGAVHRGFVDVSSLEVAFVPPAPRPVKKTDTAGFLGNVVELTRLATAAAREQARHQKPHR